jgi:hypothetical protein
MATPNGSGLFNGQVFLPLDDSFPVRPLLESVDAYRVYIDRTIEFVGTR